MKHILKQFDITGIEDNQKRVFTAWGSVEVKDRQGEIIPLAELYRILDIWMSRGGVILYRHTNRHVGRCLNWQKSEKSGVPGVLLTVQLFDDYKEDTELWDDIKSGKYEGLSFGGKSYEPVETDEGTYLTKLVGYEFSIVERCGNQEATFETINTIAKSLQMANKVKKQEEFEENATPENTSDMTEKVMNMLEQLASRMDEMEMKMAGTPETEEDLNREMNPEDEETKEYDEEEKKEDENDEVKMLRRELSSFKKALSGVTKNLTVLKAERPGQAETLKNKSMEAKLVAKMDELKQRGKLSFDNCRGVFTEMGAYMKKLENEKLAQNY